MAVRHIDVAGKDETPQPKSTKLTISGSLRHFCEETTAHGLGHFIREHSLAVQACWLLLFLAAIAGILWHLSMLVAKYLDYSTQGIIRTSHQPIDFPHVSVCNLQPISNSNEEAMERDGSLEQLKDTVEEIKGAAMSLGIPWEDVDDRVMSPISLYENLGPDVASTVGHQLQDFIVQCTINGKSCEDKTVLTQVNPTFFNCYTLIQNHSGAGYIGSGPQDGLSLVLYLEVRNSSKTGMRKLQYDQYSPVLNAIGARLVIHAPGTLPLPVTAGMDIMPGHSTSVAVNVELLLRQGEPYGDCRSMDTSPWDIPDQSYTSEACLLLCTQRYIYDNCGCFSPCLPVPSSAKNVSFCGKFQEDSPENYFWSVECEVEYSAKFHSDGLLRQGCKCFSPCTEYVYRTTMSESMWPGEQYVDDFFEDMIVTPHLNGTTLKAYEQLGAAYNSASEDFAKLVQANFARINVYFRDLDLLIQEENPSYGLSNLWSDIGGTIGLWAGLSFLTLMECIALIAKLIGACCMR
jgi:hypothetical protein